MQEVKAFFDTSTNPSSASVLDWRNMMLETRVNGQIRQSANTSQLIFDIPALIATCSMGITLQPGDVISTGTPAGVCLSSGEFLKHRDVIDISMSGLGTLSNTVGDPNRPPPACAPLNEKVLVRSNATIKGMRLAGETGPVGS